MDLNLEALDFLSKLLIRSLIEEKSIILEWIEYVQVSYSERIIGQPISMPGSRSAPRCYNKGSDFRVYLVSLPISHPPFIFTIS